MTARLPHTIVVAMVPVMATMSHSLKESRRIGRAARRDIGAACSSRLRMFYLLRYRLAHRGVQAARLRRLRSTQIRHRRIPQVKLDGLRDDNASGRIAVSLAAAAIISEQCCAGMAVVDAVRQDRNLRIGLG